VRTRFKCEFEVITLVTMKSTVFWDVTPCSPVEFYRRFEKNIVPISSGSNTCYASNEQAASK
jgi:hypothetical protein